jgi:hypothetical protein
VVAVALAGIGDDVAVAVAESPAVLAGGVLVDVESSPALARRVRCVGGVLWLFDFPFLLDEVRTRAVLLDAL